MASYYQNASSILWLVSSIRYRETISNFIFLPKLQVLYLHDMWFQQDGVACQTARVTVDLVRGEFGEHLILSSGPVNWFDLHDMWLYRDDATCRTAHVIMNLLRGEFSENFISLSGQVD